MKRGFLLPCCFPLSLLRPGVADGLCSGNMHVNNLFETQNFFFFIELLQHAMFAGLLKWVFCRCEHSFVPSFAEFSVHQML